MKTIKDITPTLQETAKKKRVAAYARVSCDKDTMLHSLEAQISYYENFISGNPEWEFAGVYADEAKTGTKENREQFQLLLAECRAGNVNMVITKSVSRFARNTVTLLQTVRELKELGIDVFFEEQNIRTLDSDGEVLLTLLASFAQAESLSVSENCKWRIRKGFEEGKTSTCTMLGYRLVDGEITLIPDEAAIVKRIFDLYAEGCGLQKICNILNEEKITTRFGCEWHPGSVRKILTNEKYMGDLRLQRYFVSDHITKRLIKNEGQLPQYYVEDDHPPVVSKAQFAMVQNELRQRSEHQNVVPGEFTVFTGKIVCSGCGKNYRRKTTPYRVVWCCSTYNFKGKKYCPTSKVIPEETLKCVSAQVLNLPSFDESTFTERVTRVEACPDNLLRFHFCDNTEKEITWVDRSRSESWTPEMREAARQRTLAR